jgi:hypothetical protein
LLGLVGISLDTPIIFALYNLSQITNQDPLKPV